MAQLGRPGLSASQKTEMWRRWKAGESHSDIGRALGKLPASIHGTIRLQGGIVPRPRSRSSRALTWEDRGDLAGNRRRSVDAGDRSVHRPCAFDSFPRDRSQWGCEDVPRGDRGRSGMRKSAPPEVLSTRDDPATASRRVYEAPAEVVSGADLRVVEAGVSS